MSQAPSLGSLRGRLDLIESVNSRKVAQSLCDGVDAAGLCLIRCVDIALPADIVRSALADLSTMRSVADDGSDPHPGHGRVVMDFIEVWGRRGIAFLVTVGYPLRPVTP